MNTNNKINPVSESRLRERFFIFIVNNFDTGFSVMKSKICTKCNNEKLINEFYNHKTGKNGISSMCKKCAKRESNEYYKSNIDRYKKLCKKYYKLHTKEIKEYQKQYKENHENERKKYYEKYYKDNKEKIKKYKRIRNKNNINLRLIRSIRGGIWVSLKGNKKGRHWETLVNYTQKDLRKHLELQFKEGMTWENYGKGKGKWNIDHKIPVSLFNINGIKSKGFKACWALENLQPMWSEDNVKKHNILFY